MKNELWCPYLPKHKGHTPLLHTRMQWKLRRKVDVNLSVCMKLINEVLNMTFIIQTIQFNIHSSMFIVAE